MATIVDLDAVDPLELVAAVIEWLDEVIEEEDRDDAMHRACRCGGVWRIPPRFLAELATLRSEQEFQAACERIAALDEREAA